MPYDNGEYHGTYQDEDIHPTPPLRPYGIRAGQLDDYQKSDEAQDKKIFIAQAIEQEKQRHDEEYPSAERVYDLLAFRQHVLITLYLLVYMLIALALWGILYEWATPGRFTALYWITGG